MTVTRQQVGTERVLRIDLTLPDEVLPLQWILLTSLFKTSGAQSLSDADIKFLLKLQSEIAKAATS